MAKMECVVCMKEINFLEGFNSEMMGQNYCVNDHNHVLGGDTNA